MNISIRIILTVAFTALFLYQFFRLRRFYLLVLGIWVPTTLLPLWVQDQTALFAIGVVQVILFFAVIVLLIFDKGKGRKAVTPATGQGKTPQRKRVETDFQKILNGEMLDIPEKEEDDDI